MLEKGSERTVYQRKQIIERIPKTDTSDSGKREKHKSHRAEA